MQYSSEDVEEIDPIVRSILDDVVIEPDAAFVNHYARWVKVLRGLSPEDHSRVFVQLAVLARQFFDAECHSVAASLGVLARIGLSRLTPAPR